MIQSTIINGAHKISRRKRFSPFTVEAIEFLFSHVGQQIIYHHKRFIPETRAGNVALAYFAKYCLSFFDRGIIFGAIYGLIKSYDLVESGFPRRYKLEFLQLLASHEHFIPLNIPVLFDSSGKPVFNLQLADQIGSDGKLYA
jgi:hypothetical protein